MLALEGLLEFGQLALQFLPALYRPDLALIVLLCGLEEQRLVSELLVLIDAAHVLDVLVEVEVVIGCGLWLFVAVEAAVVELLAVDRPARVFSDWVVPEGEELLVGELVFVARGLRTPLPFEFHGSIIIQSSKSHPNSQRTTAVCHANKGCAGVI